MFMRILSLLGCALLLSVSWMAVLNLESREEKQLKLISQAEEEAKNGTYVNAVSYLLEAVDINAEHTFDALEALKEVYLVLGETPKYVKLLKEQITYDDCPAQVYIDYAKYYLEHNKPSDAISLLKTGIELTNDDVLIALYEKERYAFKINRGIYDEMTAFHNGGIQVRRGDLWGIANSTGELVIPCAYTQIGTFDRYSSSIVAIRDDGKVVALNTENQAVAVYEKPVTQLGNLSQDIIALQLEDNKWIIANGRLIAGETQYDAVGTAHNSAIALKRENKWGVMSLSGEKILPYDYDEIIIDELGRCYAQGAVFAKKDGKAYLFANGAFLEDGYEDARPFNDTGWAAVKKNGKWGFIDTTGAFMLEPQFEEALSFSGHLAAVKQGEHWGYIGLEGNFAIQPEFMQAKSFQDSNAPVLTEIGWQIISLFE